MMRLAVTMTGIFLLIGCVTDQSAAIPPDPNAPFPLANARVTGQPQPGVLLIETSGIHSSRPAVERAARIWCAGPVSVTPIQRGRAGSGFGITEAIWLVRCA